MNLITYSTGYFRSLTSLITFAYYGRQVRNSGPGLHDDGCDDARLGGNGDHGENDFFVYVSTVREILHYATK